MSFPNSSNSAQESFGLLALSKKMGWEVSVDQTTTEPVRFLLSIENALVYARFEIPSLSTIADLANFLDQRNNSKTELAISATGPDDVSVVRCTRHF